jgi:hypothetical protein
MDYCFFFLDGVASKTDFVLMNLNELGCRNAIKETTSKLSQEINEQRKVQGRKLIYFT